MKTKKKNGKGAESQLLPFMLLMLEWGCPRRQSPLLCSLTPSSSVGGGLTGVGLGQRPLRPGTKIKSEDICDFSDFCIIGCRGLNSSREWRQPHNAWLRGHQRSAPSPALRWNSAKKLKLLAAYIDLIPCTEKDKQFQNAEGVCETTNDGGVQGTSTSFGILSNYSSFYTRLNFNVLWKMDGT